MREIYAGIIIPLPDVKDWQIPEPIESKAIGTPENPKQAGRPREKRMLPGGQPLPQGATVKRRRNPKKCGICGILGHTRRKCQDPRRFE